MKELPIEKCPIVQVFIDIRFELIDNKTANEVVGKLMPVISSTYNQFEALPINNIPENVRRKDPNLQYKPLFKLFNNNSSVQIGSDIIILDIIGSYKGWDDLKSRFDLIYKEITPMIKTNTRIGMRYVNLIEHRSVEYNIFDDLSLQISTKDFEIDLSNSFYRNTFLYEGFNCNLSLANKVNFESKNLSKNGSLIDIDIFNQSDIEPSKVSTLLNQMHEVEKKLFYKLITDDLFARFQTL
ncbi:TIGR04255 family protein [Halosquirtibacter xylanolyticus]|uniref:TIGR04255 family protein n=1 Tax=Halosquirtibacter xylanolyticus TaxID=3374599 RepID=UPI0037492710|nr:TIGR04255 family protein [Prolixibacteraceae bacterium]